MIQYTAANRAMSTMEVRARAHDGVAPQADMPAIMVAANMTEASAVMRAQFAIVDATSAALREALAE